MGKKKKLKIDPASTIINEKSRSKLFYNLDFVTCVYCMVKEIPFDEPLHLIQGYNNRQPFNNFRTICSALGFEEFIFEKIIKNSSNQIKKALNQKYSDYIIKRVSLKTVDDITYISIDFIIQLEEGVKFRTTVKTDMSGEKIFAYRYSFVCNFQEIKSEVFHDIAFVPQGIKHILTKENFLISNVSECSFQCCNKGLFNKIISLTDSKQLVWKFSDKMYRAVIHDMKLCYAGNKKTALCGCIGVENSNGVIYYIDEDYVILEHLIAQINNTSVNLPYQGNTKAEIKNSAEIQTRHIEVTDFIVRTVLSKCVHEEHELLNVNALVKIMSKHIIKEYSFPAMFCNTCKKYYIYENTYQRMKHIGHICCKVIEYNALKEAGSGSFGEWQKKSMLSLYGYNVNCNSNLSEQKRHEILDFIIENNIMSPYEVINHLEMFANLRNNQPNMKKAIEKWHDDIAYVQDKNVKGLYNVRVNRIVKKY